MTRSADEKDQIPQSQSVVPEELEIAALRRRLLGYYETDQVYAAVVAQDLRPLWETTTALIADRSRLRSAVRKALAEGSPIEQMLLNDYPDARPYAERVLSVGPNLLGLIAPVNHQTPSWVATKLHADVTSREIERLRRAGHIILNFSRSYDLPNPASCDVKVWPTAVHAELPGMWTDEYEGFDDEVHIDVAPALGYAFDDEHWKRLEAEAIRLLRDGIRRIRVLTEEVHVEWRRPKAMARREAEVEHLFRWLMRYRTPVERSERQRLRSLCRLLDLQPPLHRN